MVITEEQGLKNREIALKNIEAGRPQNEGVITVDDLQSVTPIEPITTPNVPAPTMPELPEMPKIETPVKETKTTEAIKRIQELQGVTAEEEALRKQQEATPEMEALRKTESDLTGQLKQLIAESKQIPLQIQQEAEGRGVTRAGMLPIETGRLRENAIKALGVSALLDATQGNIASALDKIDRAVEAEFAVRKAELDTALTNLNLISFLPDLTAEEKNKIADRNAFIEYKKQEADIQKVERKEVYDIGLKAREFGAPTSIVQSIFGAKSREEAVLLAGGFLREQESEAELQKLEIELQNLQLDTIIKTGKIKEDVYKLNLLKEYGGLTPDQFNKKLKEQESEIKAQDNVIDKAKAQGRVLNDKVKLIESITESRSLDSVVGPTPFTRGFGRASGWIPKGISLITGTLNLGVVDEFLGADDVVGLVEQLVSKEFLQSLIDVKAQGATFGALQKAEQDALTNAAIAVGNARIYRGKGEERKTIGYDMSEKEFKNQLNIIKTNAELAYKRSVNESFMPDEQALFNELERLQQQDNFNPSY